LFVSPHSLGLSVCRGPASLSALRAIRACPRMIVQNSRQRVDDSAGGVTSQSPPRAAHTLPAVGVTSQSPPRQRVDDSAGGVTSQSPPRAAQTLPAGGVTSQSPPRALRVVRPLFPRHPEATQRARTLPPAQQLTGGSLICSSALTVSVWVCVAGPPLSLLSLSSRPNNSND